MQVVKEECQNKEGMSVQLHPYRPAPGRTQARGGSVVLWNFFFWETLGPAIPLELPPT